MKKDLIKMIIEEYREVLFKYLLKPEKRIDKDRKMLINRVMKHPRYKDVTKYKDKYLADDINCDILANRFKDNEEIFKTLTGKSNEDFKGIDSQTFEKQLVFLILNNEILDYNYEKDLIDKILENTKEKFLDKPPVKDNIDTLLDNDINASIVSGCLLAKLKHEYNLDFDIYFENFYNKLDFLKGKINYDQLVKAYNSYNKGGIAYYDDNEKFININISKIIKKYIDNPHECETEILGTVFHEFNHALMFSKMKEINKTTYKLFKNINYINNDNNSYKKYHDYYEIERLANCFAKEQLKQRYNRSNKYFDNSAKVIYSNIYDRINSQGEVNYLFENLERKPLKDLSRLIKNKDLLNEIVLNKHINTFSLYSKEELQLIKEALILSKNEEYNKVFALADENNETFNRYFRSRMEKIKKLDKKINKIKI